MEYFTLHFLDNFLRHVDTEVYHFVALRVIACFLKIAIPRGRSF